MNYERRGTLTHGLTTVCVLHKGKVHPRTGHENLDEERSGKGWSKPRPGYFTPRKEIRYPLYRRLGGPQGRFGRVRKISPTPGIDLRTDRPVAGRYSLPTAHTGRFLFCKQWQIKMFHPLRLHTTNCIMIATRYGLDSPGIESRRGRYFRTCPDRLWGPPSLLYSGNRAFPRVKRPGRYVDHTPHLAPRSKKE